MCLPLLEASLAFDVVFFCLAFLCWKRLLPSKSSLFKRLFNYMPPSVCTVPTSVRRHSLSLWMNFAGLRACKNRSNAVRVRPREFFQARVRSDRGQVLIVKFKPAWGQRGPGASQSEVLVRKEPACCGSSDPRLPEVRDYAVWTKKSPWQPVIGNKLVVYVEVHQFVLSESLEVG